jgi:RNA recognition motif-containing protein
MEIFVGHLPENATPADLKAFFKGYGKQTRCIIVEILHNDRTITRHGYVVIEPDRAAHKAIKRLSLKRLNGQRVAVREYIHRAYANDRRALGWRHKPWRAAERRMDERRKPGKIRSVWGARGQDVPEFHGYKALAIKYD